MLDLSTELRTRGINLRVLNLGGGNVDTGTPMGGMVFTVMAALAQMELEIANASPTAQTPLLLHNSRTRLMRYGVPGEPGGNHHVLLAGASNTGESRPRLSSSTESRTFTLHRYPFAPWWLLASTDDAI
jgi:hypothetical protein